MEIKEFKCVGCNRDQFECELMGIKNLDLFGNGVTICVDCVIPIILKHWEEDVYEVIRLHSEKRKINHKLAEISDKSFKRGR